jgi:branched-chain amino acid transport system substrate-binding protein
MVAASMFPRLIAFVLIGLALAHSPWTSAGPAQEREPVRLGIIYTNSGPLAQLGVDMRDGNLLYWSQVGNRAGGRRVEIFLESTASNKPDEGLTKARKLVERDRVHVLTGVLETPVAYALRPYVNEKKIPLMINIAGADGLTQKQRGDYIFRSSFSNSQASHPLGEWAFKQGYRKMVLLASDFAAGHEHIGGVARTFVGAGGQVIQEIYPPLGAPDFAPYLAQIRRDADVVAVAIFGSDALRVVAQYAEYGLKGKIPLIGKGGLTDEAFLEKLGDAALGIVVAYHWSAALDIPENRRYREAFEGKYKRTASLTAESGYAGAQMIARALEAVKGDVENLEPFLTALKKVEIDAPRGKVTLDAFHNPVDTIYMLKTERKGGGLHNAPIASYPNVSQFWTWKPEEFMALPPYGQLKGAWAK